VEIMMNDVRIVTLDCLLRRLQEVLGQDSLLLRRFDNGLRLEDERSLTDAMSSLRLYPEDIRRCVEATVMSWLFGSRTAELDIRQGAAPRA
jgi:hypothetical protein